LRALGKKSFSTTPLFPNNYNFLNKIYHKNKYSEISNMQNKCMEITLKVIEATKLPNEYNSICSLISDYAART